MRVAAATAFLPPLLPHEPKAEGGGCCHTHSKGPSHEPHEMRAKRTALALARVIHENDKR